MRLSKYRLILGLKLVCVAVFLSSCISTCRQEHATQNANQNAAPASIEDKQQSDKSVIAGGPPATNETIDSHWQAMAYRRSAAARALKSLALGADDGIAPVELTWNAWAEPASPTPSFSPVTFLKPGDQNQNYQLVLDLAALAYRDGPSVYSKTASNQLRDRLLSLDGPDVDLKLFIIPDERLFQTAKRTETLRVNLDRLRKAMKEGIASSTDPFKMLQRDPNQEFSFGRVQINFRTLNQEGSGSIAIALWAGGVMPVDELSIPLCVASNAEAAKNCKTGKEPHDSLSGIDPLKATAQQEAFALKPDAALHFIELDSATEVGIFRDNEWPEGEYESWRLKKSAKATRQYLQQTLLPEFDSATNEAALLTVGSELYSLLFPIEYAREARQVFAEFIARHRELKDPGNPPSIFVRMLSDDSEEPPFLIPLGLMVHDIGGKKDFLGFHFRIQTPLQIQDYQPYSKCIGSWVVLAPKAGASGIPTELNDARKRFSKWFVTWKFEPISEMPAFIEWARKDISETEPVSLFILAHQDSNSLYFAPSPRLGSAAIERRFKTPSVAVVNGCATGAPGSSAIVQKLNERGVSAVIATAGKVDKHLAGDFFSVLGRYLTESPEGREYSLGAAYFLTLRELKAMAPDPDSATYGAKVLAYELMGNSSLRVCSPPRKPRRGP